MSSELSALAGAGIRGPDAVNFVCDDVGAEAAVEGGLRIPVVDDNVDAAETLGLLLELLAVGA